MLRNNGGRITITDFSRKEAPPPPPTFSPGNVTPPHRLLPYSPTDDHAVDDVQLYEFLDIPLPMTEYELSVAAVNGTPLPLRPRHIVSDVPYPLSKYTGFMLDDHRILAFRVSLPFSSSPAGNYALTCLGRLMEMGSRALTSSVSSEDGNPSFRDIKY
jgi:hypothetical protein